MWTIEYGWSSVVCLSVCHVCEPCKSGWTDRDAILWSKLGGPKEACIRWCMQQIKSITASAWLLQPTALLPTGQCHVNFSPREKSAPCSAACHQYSFTAFYPHIPIGKVWICWLLFVCVCVFVRLRISPARIKLAASNFARWFIGVLGRESPILRNFALPEAQNRTNRLLYLPDSHAYQVRAACGRGIGMCGYTAVPEDGRTCLYFAVSTVNYCTVKITFCSVAVLCSRFDIVDIFFTSYRMMRMTTGCWCWHVYLCRAKRWWSCISLLARLCWTSISPSWLWAFSGTHWIHFGIGLQFEPSVLNKT